MFGKDSQLTFIIILLTIFGLMGFYWFLTTQGIDISNYQLVKPKPPEAIVEYPEKMIISSTAFANGEPIPEKYTCSGIEVNPPLEFSEIPVNTKSLALTFEDPDAPYKTWVHWVMFNINPDTKGIRENSVAPGAILGENDFGKGEYGGPCPPIGKHRYFFNLYALDKVLESGAGSSKEEVTKEMKGHILDRATLMGTFEK